MTGTTTSKNIDAWADTLARGEQVVIRNSRIKAAVAVLFVLVLFLSCLAIALFSESGPVWKILGWLGVLLFLWCLVVFGRRLFSPRPSVVVSTEGVWMKSAKAGVVPWSQMTTVEPVEMHNNLFIQVVITTQEAERQAAAGIGVAEEELMDGTTRPVLWLPTGLAVKKRDLISWLEQERQARSAA